MLQLISDGLTNHELATKLLLAVLTVDNQRKIY
ncbi:MAG: hypothetical protein IPN97_08090 [Saprospiraceae bacterium]|nr:hypothetical protein [Saprospiraceae bacterium]